MLLLMPQRRKKPAANILDRAKIKALREAKELTQDQAAEKAGLLGGRARWSEIETGRRQAGLTLDSLAKIAAALDVRPADLLVREDDGTT